MRRLLLLVCLLAAGFISRAPTADAHEMTMAEMEMHESSRGVFTWMWTATNDSRPSEILRPVWPEGCVTDVENLNVLRCGEQGLTGVLTVDGVGKGAYSAALIKIEWLDGQTRIHTLTGGQPNVRLFGSAEDHRSRWEIARAYTVLGVEHILTGYDHLLFVMGLLFLVGFQRKLIWTITAFTAAHSLTLASASLGILTLRSPPVEASIALSIVLVANEALHKRETLARRWPALLAFLFGLVHGLGFAGALQEVGLPQNFLPTALLMFNVGVEIGQLFVVGIVWLAWSQLQRWTAVQRARTPLLYGIGAVAAYWSWLRVVAILG